MLPFVAALALMAQPAADLDRQTREVIDMALRHHGTAAEVGPTEAKRAREIVRKEIGATRWLPSADRAAALVDFDQRPADELARDLATGVWPELTRVSDLIAGASRSVTACALNHVASAWIDRQPRKRA